MNTHLLKTFEWNGLNSTMENLQSYSEFNCWSERFNSTEIKTLKEKKLNWFVYSIKFKE